MPETLTDKALDPDFLEATYRIAAVHLLVAMTPIVGGMVDNAADFRKLNLDFLGKFGTYLVSLNDEEKDEIDVLLSDRLEADNS